MHQLLLLLILNCSITTPRGLTALLTGVRDAQSYNDFGHHEGSDGQTVTGSYYVALHDGRLQAVDYKADDSGYLADVKYQGEAKYPDYGTQLQYQSAPGSSSFAAAAYQASAPRAPTYRAISLNSKKK